MNYYTSFITGSAKKKSELSLAYIFMTWFHSWTFRLYFHGKEKHNIWGCSETVSFGCGYSFLSLYLLSELCIKYLWVHFCCLSPPCPFPGIEIWETWTRSPLQLGSGHFPYNAATALCAYWATVGPGLLRTIWSMCEGWGPNLSIQWVHNVHISYVPWTTGC